MGRPKQFDPDVAVEQAMQVFWAKGYAGTTPQDLVDALGIGKGSLYNAFGSKRELFDRALQRYRQYQAEAIAEQLERPGPVKERLAAGLRFLVESNLHDEQPRGCLAVNTATELAGVDAGATEQVRRSFDRTELAFRTAIDEGQRTGEIDAALDARSVASLLLAATVGMQVLARTATEPDRLVRIVEAAIATV